MVVLNIYSLDDIENQNVIACLPSGKHVIGRGGILKVTDKRVSRKHAVIDVSDDNITITSVHQNPCFFKAANGRALTVLSKDESTELGDTDQFALLPENYWFKVQIKKDAQDNECAEENGDCKVEINGKRHHENNSELGESVLESKRARFSTTIGDSSLNRTENEASTSNTSQEVQNKETSHSEHIKSHKEGEAEDQNALPNIEIKEEIEVVVENAENIPENNLGNEESLILNDPHEEITTREIKEESSDNLDHETTVSNAVPNDNDDENDAEQKPVIKTENNNDQGQNDGNTNQGAASGSGGPGGTTNSRRERCWYAATCFRKNPNHRDTFSHPGDQDYDSDPNDDRPNCPFGTACYRKNIDHRRQYKHTNKPVPKPKPPTSPTNATTSPKPKKPRKAATKKPKLPDESSEDDYDYSDPFICDGSSDEFVLSDDDDDDDTDWDDSQVVEESQERKRMLKEAKKFIKKKD